MTYLLSKLPRLKLIEENPCSQEFTDSLCELLFTKHYELLERMCDIEMGAGDPYELHVNIVYRYLCMEIKSVVDPVLSDSDLKDPELWFLYFMYELNRRVRKELNLDPLKVFGKQLTPKNTPFTRDNEFDISPVYNKHPHLFVLISTGMRLSVPDIQTSEFFKQELLKQVSLEREKQSVVRANEIIIEAKKGLCNMCEMSKAIIPEGVEL